MSGIAAVLLVFGVVTSGLVAGASSSPAGTATTAATATSGAAKPSTTAAAATHRSIRRTTSSTSKATRHKKGGSFGRDGRLAKEVVALKAIAPHVKHVKQHKAKRAVKVGSLKALTSGKAALAAPLDEQFAGLDENNIDSDQLNEGDDYSADTNGAVGPKYYGEVVGFGYGFFDKATGALVDDDTLTDFYSGTGMGSPCVAGNSDGYTEPHILYDSQADRWIIMVTAESNPDTITATGAFDECIGVSTSGDPVNGSWNFYMVPLIGAGALDVYGSAVGVWNNGIYFSEAIGCTDAATLCPGYNANEDFVGTQVWAFNRSDLESGAPLRVQTTQGVGGIGSGNFTGARTTTTFSNLDADQPVPANMETMTGAPPAGRNEYFVSMSDLPGTAATPLGDGLLDVWQYHVDWTNSSNSWIGQSPTSQINYQVITPTYGVPDLSSSEITSAGPSAYANQVDTQFDYILQEPQYTDFGGVESLWTAHATSVCSGTCNKNSTTGPDQIRWNQISLNSSDGSPVTAAPAQGQDYVPSPATLNRWLPAIGVDQNGDMAVGYSGTSSTVYPSLYIAGRASTDPTNTLTSLPETEVDAGDGYQTGSVDGTPITYFGPENSMSLDPNGCEMYFAGQTDVGSPTAADGSDDAWATEITAFHFPGCTASTLATSLATSGNADATAGSATLTATLTATGTGSGVVGEPVAFTLGGVSVGTAVTNSLGVATLSGVDASAYASGSYAGSVGASYAGDPTYGYGGSTSTGSLLVGSTQTISFGSLSNQTYGNAPFTLSATASSGLPVSFAATGADANGTAGSGSCSVSVTTVTITGAGICTITATQPGDGTSWLPAAPVSQTFDIAQQTQSISVTGTWSTTSQTIGTDFQATATSSSGGQVYFTSDEVNCTEVDNGDTPQDEFVPLHTGTCTIYAEQEGTTNIAQVILPISVTVTGTGLQTGTFAVTSSSRRLDQLQNTLDPVTWSSGLTSSTYSTTGTVSAGGIAAALTSTIGGSAAATIAAGKDVDSSTPACSGGTATATTSKSHGFAAGELVTITGLSPAGYDVTNTAIKSVPSTTTFTYCVASSTLTTSTGSGSAVGSAAISESGTTATVNVTTAPATPFAAGQVVNIAGSSVTGYNNINYTILSAPTTTSFTVTATAGLGGATAGTVGLPGTGASEAGGVATITLSTTPSITLSPGGSVTIAGSSNAGYNGTYTIVSAPTATTFTVTPTSTTLAASGGGSISVVGTSCTANTSVPGAETLTALHAGTCTVTAIQAGNADFPAATASKTYTISTGTQSLTWNQAAGNISDANPTMVTATSNSGLAPGTVTTMTSTVCSVGSTTTGTGTSTVTITPLADGTCILSAAGNPGSLDWSALAAKAVSYITTSAGSTQTITFAGLPPVTLADSVPTLSATASSGLAVSFTSSTPSVCTTGGSNGATVTLVAPGTCTIAASQAGVPTVTAPATTVNQSFNVTTADQLLAFNQLPDATYGSADFGLTGSLGAQSVNAYSLTEVATGTPTGLAVTYTAGGTCTVDSGGTDVHLTGAGTCVITASQSGSAVYNPAPSIVNEFTVSPAASSILFSNPGSQTYGAPDFTAGATATSGEAVGYTASGACSILSGLVHLTAVGSCTVTAHSVGDANYSPPAAVSQTFSVAQATQSINFSVAAHTYGDPDFTISATATSGLPVTFTLESGHCTLSGSTVHITGAGNCSIAADQAGNADYSAAPEVVDTFNINQATQSITFPTIPTHAADDPDFDPGATASSGLPVSYTASPAVTCSITAGNQVEIDGTGLCTVIASQAGNANYNPASKVSQTFSIGAGDQTITFADPSDQTYGGPDLDPGATASSGLPVSYAASPAGVCSVTAGNQVELDGTGTCTVTASQGGDSSWNAATPVSQSFAIDPAAQTITFPSIATQEYGNGDFQPGASATSGLTVSYTASGSCSITGGGDVEIDGAGSCSVTSSQPGDADYDAAANVVRTFTITKASQTIAFSVGDHTYGDADFTISATATSGDPVTFSVQSGDCTVSGSVVHITGTGDCAIAADQAGDSNYLAAPEVVDTFNINQADQSITFPTIPGQAYGEADFAPGATASSNLAVAYSAAGVCTITSGGLIHLTATGNCTVTAAQAGNGDYNPASNVVQSFSVSPGSQTITFANPGTQTYGEAPFTVVATSSSGLPVSFSASGDCTINSSGQVTIIGAVFCKLTAAQSGNSLYNAAPSVSDTFHINGMTTTTVVKATPKKVKEGATLHLSANVKGTSTKFHPTGTVTFYVNGTQEQTVSVSSKGKATSTYTVSLPVQAASYPVYAVFNSSSTAYVTSTSATVGVTVKPA